MEGRNRLRSLQLQATWGNLTFCIVVVRQSGATPFPNYQVYEWTVVYNLLRFLYQVPQQQDDKWYVLALRLTEDAYDHSAGQLQVPSRLKSPVLVVANGLSRYWATVRSSSSLCSSKAFDAAITVQINKIQP